MASYLMSVGLLLLALDVPAVDAANNESLSHTRVVASVACMHRTANDFGESGPPLWHDDTYHLRYSTFRDSDEGYPGWHLVYVLVYNPNRVNGWIYKLYVHRSKPMIEIGQIGTIKVDHYGRVEIDEVWGGLGTHDLISQRLQVIEHAPLIRVAEKEANESSFNCYDWKHPSAE